MASPAPPPVADLAALPAVDRVLALPAIGALTEAHGRTLVLGCVREVLAALRALAVEAKLDARSLEPDALATAIEQRLTRLRSPGLQPVLNLTGTVLHTNLGRAPLPSAAVMAVAAAAASPVLLEYDRVSGRRGERDRLVAPLLAALSRAEAATVVNNGAAALVLVLGALARGREVIVSRGELIEIGGSFRLPDLMRAAGARLVEVGTTNRTHLEDYAAAITPRTALVLKVHPSNYVIAGFTSGVEAAALAPLTTARGVPLVVDLGSGALADLTAYGLPAEPVVAATVEAGADLVLFSGDKLLGGPQAGLIVGREALVRRLNRHPLKRALRPGKLILAALEAVLDLYRSPEHLAAQLTTLALLTRDARLIEAQARRLAPRLAALLGARYSVAAEPVRSQIGSGAQPGETLPSFALSIRTAGSRSAGISRLAARLRLLEPAVLGRIADDTLYLDLRCLRETDETLLWLALEGLSR